MVTSLGSLWNKCKMVMSDMVEYTKFRLSPFMMASKVSLSEVMLVSRSERMSSEGFGNLYSIETLRTTPSLSG